MKIAKIIFVLIGIYIGIVVLFESSLGYFQPENSSTLTITTFDQGQSHTRVVSKVESEGVLYIAANHWPRAWFRQTLANPQIEAMIDGESGRYLAVLMEGEEHERLIVDKYPGLVFRTLTGFPPRYFLKLVKQ